MPEPERETRELSCALTDAELLKYADEMAACELAIEALKDERKHVNERIAAQVERRAELAHAIDAKADKRDVICKWIEDFAHKCWNLIRQDTGEQVDQETMTAEDLQAPMFGDAETVEPGNVRPIRRHIDPEPEHLDA
jgi:septal ring factor EnvC (AmiA/AmiB activator)